VKPRRDLRRRMAVYMRIMSFEGASKNLCGIFRYTHIWQITRQRKNNDER